MHPLSVFPALLTYGLLAPLLLRLAVGLFILYIGWQRYGKTQAWASIFYAVAGVLLVLGWYTQPAVILSILIIKFDFWVDKNYHLKSKDKIISYSLVSAILISLLFTGPGFMAFDLPL